MKNLILSIAVICSVVSAKAIVFQNHHFDVTLTAKCDVLMKICALYDLKGKPRIGVMTNVNKYTVKSYLDGSLTVKNLSKSEHDELLETVTTAESLGISMVFNIHPLTKEIKIVSINY